MIAMEATANARMGDFRPIFLILTLFRGSSLKVVSPACRNKLYYINRRDWGLHMP